MLESNIIKSITIHTCPNCGKEVYVETQMIPPVIGTLFTEFQMKEAKTDCLERVSLLSIDDEKKDAVTKWINDPETIFGPNEVDNIITSLLKPEE
jgi:hypothetical protein